MLQSEAFYRLRVSLLQPSLFKGHERWSLKIHSCLGRTLEQRVCVCVDVCLWNDVWKCQTLWRCRRSSCGSSSTPSRIFSRIFVVVVLKPQVRTSTSLYKHFVIPLLTTEFAVYGYGRNGKRQNTWCEDATWTLLTQKKKHLKVKELSLLCSPILFDWPSFDLNKKGVREPPGGSLWVWRHFSVLLALGVNPRRVEREV